MLLLGVGSLLVYIRSEFLSLIISIFSFYTSISYTSLSISRLYFHPIPLFQYITLPLASFASSSQSIQTLLDQAPTL